MIQGDGEYSCRGRDLAFREMMLFSAILLTVYDIKLPQDQEWVVPPMTTRYSTRVPTKPMHLWIKRRQLSRLNEQRS